MKTGIVRNNFDLVRLLLAGIVVLTHLYSLTGIVEYLPFRRYLSGDFAVKGFFAVSGYLVTQSFVNSQSLKDFAERRLRRILPPYVLIVFIGLVIGLIFTRLTIDQFFVSKETWKYLGANLLFMNFLQPTLPGVFLTHEEAVINPSLWTIKIELCLYFCVPLIALFFKRTKPIIAIAVIYALSVIWLIGLRQMGKETHFLLELSRQFPGQLSYFAAGAFLSWQPVDRVKLFVAIVVGGAAWFFLKSFEVRLIVEPLFFSGLVIFFAVYLPSLGHVGKHGDFSYSMYLFHAPLIHIFHELGIFRYSPWVGFAGFLLVLLCLCYLSWKYVEKPFLKRTVNNVRISTSDRPVSV
jgi:peptidoglycan/LPS O-acetylase OafA/YrhL